MQVGIMASIGESSHRTSAVKATMKACEHSAGQVASLVSHVQATSPSLERVSACAPLTLLQQLITQSELFKVLLHV